MRLWLAFLFTVLFMTTAQAGTFTAATCNQSAVNAIINGPTHTTVDGDVISIPAGTCIWASGITVPSGIGITVQGVGTPNSSPTTTGASSSCSATTITITNGSVAFIMQPAQGNSTTRLSCMNIASGAGSGVFVAVLGSCTASGCPNLRMDNITFTNWATHPNVGNSYGINAIGDMFGVLDHNTINGAAGNYLQLVEQSNASYLGVGLYGDNSWAQPENYGSANFLYFENNLFNNAGATENEGTAGNLTNQGGGRVVARFNTFNVLDNFNFSLGWHGTESSGRPRSSRAYEFYKNTWSCNSTTNGCPPVIGARGGTGLAWGNTFTATAGSTWNSILAMNTYRTQGNPAAPWNACDGSSVYDTNDGTTYYSGTISLVSGAGPFTITVSGSPGWTANQWSPNGAPYSMHDVTKTSGAEISANTTNTLTITSSGGPGSLTPSAGDSIQILRATVCLDQAGGRGAGVLYSGLTPQSTPANQALSPSYLWMDSLPSGGVIAGSDTARVIQNREFYTEAASFNGTAGTGFGTLANRPATCTPRVAYWATDQGNWNQSGSGGQGQLYICTAANTWTLSYTPYTYPHPLTGGTTVTAPAPQTNLKAVPNH